jgi:hypothetical protein
MGEPPAEVSGVEYFLKKPSRPKLGCGTFRTLSQPHSRPRLPFSSRPSPLLPLTAEFLRSFWFKNNRNRLEQHPMQQMLAQVMPRARTRTGGVTGRFR